GGGRSIARSAIERGRAKDTPPRLAPLELADPPPPGAGGGNPGARLMHLLYSIFIDPFVQMGSAPDLLVQTLWEGLVGGMLYALIALGFVLIFKASGVVNFAQGIMVVFAALTLVGFYEHGVPAFLALALTIVVMFVLAFAVERLVLRPLVNQAEIIFLLATLRLYYIFICL